MKIRIITALLGLLVVIPVLWFSNTVILEIFISLISILGVYEVIRCIGQHKNLFILIPCMIFSGFYPFCVRILSESKLGVSQIELYVIVSVSLTLWIMGFSVFSKGKLPVEAASLIFFMTMYITFGFSGIVSARNLEHGQYLYLLILIAAWIPDTGAYFVGVKFGKHKLIPDVSPKKTVEGAFGGVFTCMLVFAIYTFIVNKVFDAGLNIVLMLIASVILTVVSMIGDLVASLIKRRYKIKDYGKLLPGHGGIMDRFDSVLAVSCVFNVLFMVPYFAYSIVK